MWVGAENIGIIPDASVPLGADTVRARLDVVEPLGGEAFLSARIGAKEITARVPPQGLLSALAVMIVITSLLSGVNYARLFARRASSARAKTQ